MIKVPSLLIEASRTVELTATKEDSRRNSIPVTCVVFHHFCIIHNTLSL